MIVGLTVVAFGTSAPELAVNVAAAWSGQADVALGNVVGSNVFNLLGVLGLASLVSPAGIGVADQALRFDLPVMLAVAVACLPIFVTGREIARWDGSLFFAYYIAYTVYGVMAAVRHAALGAYSTGMPWFILPLTAVTLMVLFARHHLSQNGNGPRLGT